MSFGSNLRRLRKEKGLTQTQLAERAGVKATHMTKLEKDLGDPKLSTVYKFMEALECDAGALLEGRASGGLNGMLDRAFKMASNLPAKQKATLLDVVEQYYLAASVKNAVRSTGSVPEDIVYGIREDMEDEEIEREIIDIAIREDEETAELIR